MSTLPSTTQHPVKLAGITYYASPLTDEAYDRLDEYCRAIFAKGQAALLNAVTDPKLQQIIIDSALRQMALISWSNELGRQMMVSVAGMQQLLYESVRINHRDLSFQTFRQHLLETIKTDAEVVRYSNQLFNYLNGKGEEPPKGKATTRKPLPKRKRTGS